VSLYNKVVLDALSELADTSYQERVWSGHSHTEMSSFDECVERLFDDSGLAIALDQGTVYGVETDDLLRELGTLVGSVHADVQVDDLLRDPVLAQCRSLAARILEALTDPVEGSDDA
jgi:hypothetical protein